MRKMIFGLIVAALSLQACDTPAPLIQVPVENVDNIPLKIADLDDESKKSWSEKDLVNDTIPGMSVAKTYKEVITGKGETVIVAVVDSGVDIDHEDLKNIIWTNTDEVPNNNIDDDRNGYVDDIHGWNFLGDVVDEQLEYSRIIQKYEPQFKGKTRDQIAKKDQKWFDTYKAARAEYDAEYNELKQQKEQYENIVGFVEQAHQAFAKKLGKEDYTKEELMAASTGGDTQLMQFKNGLTQMFEYADTMPEFLDTIKGDLESMQKRLDTNFNLNADYRSVVGDNPDNFKDDVYGNNNVAGPDLEAAKHGTHVSGIIAAERNNGKGMNGVANNVLIMPVRAVPDGDERDKDIALAIRYAVDNGAKVINTSFGKYYATNPEWVYDAIKYAAKKDVLIVNAAGNESLDLDGGKTVYPNDQLDNLQEFANNVITVGALNYKYGGNLVAPFSNYGKSNVDIFAPGMEIYATTPNNEYEFLQGTSMAAPNVAGVAAMLRSYYPEFSANDIKRIILSSGVPTNTSVVVGGDPENTAKFSELSKSGKMINMFNAFKMAELSKNEL
ncbi:MAG: S8 family peptidase [Leeuwenhoekiella sp.]